MHKANWKVRMENNWECLLTVLTLLHTSLATLDIPTLGISHRHWLYHTGTTTLVLNNTCNSTATLSLLDTAGYLPWHY